MKSLAMIGDLHGLHASRLAKLTPERNHSASHAGMSFPSHDRAISLPQVRNSHDAGRCRAQIFWSRFAHVSRRSPCRAAHRRVVDR